jgi:hypothetical protein
MRKWKIRAGRNERNAQDKKERLGKNFKRVNCGTGVPLKVKSTKNHGLHTILITDGF